MRQALIIVAVLAFAVALPIELFWFGWALKKTFLEAPVWVSVVVLVAHCLTCFGIASLIDKRRQQP